MPDFRSLISRMADELDYYRQLLMDDRRETHALATEARAALAEPAPKWPTLAEIDDLCAEHTFHYEDDESLECLLLIITDALARWGSPGMQSLADGEVAELVNHARSSNTRAVALAVALEQLADAADEYGPAGGADGKALSEAVKRARKTLNRAAELDGTQPTSGKG